jgi:hypothetical protein
MILSLDRLKEMYEAVEKASKLMLEFPGIPRDVCNAAANCRYALFMIDTLLSRGSPLEMTEEQKQAVNRNYHPLRTCLRCHKEALAEPNLPISVIHALNYIPDLVGMILMDQEILDKIKDTPGYQDVIKNLRWSCRTD